MKNTPKLSFGFILLFILSAGCAGEKKDDGISPVQYTDAPYVTGQGINVTPSTIAKFSLTSQVLQNGGFIPEKYTCDGTDVSPQLFWAMPENTKSLALIMDDPDAPGGIFSHWVLFNIPANVTSLPEGVPKVDRPDGLGIQGKNDFDNNGYDGPCPPAGKPHTYRFILYSLDAELNLKPGASKDEVEKAMEGHIINKVELNGKYGR